MPPEAINALAGLFGTLFGAVAVWVAVRKMPGEMNSTNSTTLKNVLESNRLLSERLENQEDEIRELRSWFTGTIEITTRVELSNPPRILTADIRKVPAIAPDRV